MLFMERHMRTTQSNDTMYTVAKKMVSLSISLDFPNQHQISLFFTQFYQWLQLSQVTKHESLAKRQLLQGMTNYI
jgi:hypothetical protein